MGQKIKKLKKIRLHREGTDQLVTGAIALVAIAAILWTTLDNKIPFWAFVVVFGTVYGIVLNFYRCPIRYLNVEDTSKLVVAPADGKIVVIEEVENAPYFGDRRLMISIFMSLWNVHANWFPVNGTVKHVSHQNGRFRAAYLPKSSTENERSAVVITTRNGVDVLARQIAGALARRIVTYAKVGDKCHVDEQMGFIKFGSRVDVYLPVGTEVLVEMDQKVTGNQTPIARLGK